MHLIVALVAGVVIAIMATSGVLLSYQRQVVAWTDSGVASTEANTEPASAEKILARVRAELPKGVSVTRLTLKSDPRVPTIVSISDGSTRLVDPQTGATLKRSASRGVFHAIEDIHRALALGLLHHRDAGTSVTGFCNALFLFLVLSGIYLWMPRKWSRRALRAGILFDPHKRGKARDFNWHNVFGFWCALPLLVIVISGIFMSYPALTRLAEKGNGAKPGDTAAQSSIRAANVTPPSMDELFATAALQVPGWQAIALRLPASASAALAFSVMKGDGVRPNQWTRLTIDGKTGTILRRQQYEDFETLRKGIAWGRWLHTGEAGGFAGQTVAAIASMGAAMLVYTGLALAWRRFFRRKKESQDETQS